MLAFKLAIKNLIGAGLRTWLSVAALSVAYVIILLHNGMVDGWKTQAIRDSKEWEIGGGQLYQETYDPYDVFTLKDAHAPLPSPLQKAVGAGEMVPILVRQAAIFPNGRMQNVQLRGIPVEQQILSLPTSKMTGDSSEIPVLIGPLMADNAGLKKGDRVQVRWRDKNGTFDARQFLIADIFETNVITVDAGQFWMPLEKLTELTGMQGEATYLVAATDYQPTKLAGWKFQSQDLLLTDLKAIIQAERISGMVVYSLLLLIALLAIFDTQVLAIFRRQKEIGTFIALGMTRKQVMQMFTMEGSAISILGAVFAVVWGGPLLYYLAQNGIPIGAAKEAGLGLGDYIYPVYYLSVIVTTFLVVSFASTIASYIPSRKIAQMKPTDALKGKLQ